MPDIVLQADFSPYPANSTGSCVLCMSSLRDNFEASGRKERCVNTGTTRGFPDRPGECEEEFCESCAVAIGRCVGMLTPDQSDAAEARAAAAEAARDLALAETDDLRAALAALTRAGGWQGPPDADGVLDDPGDTDPFPHELVCDLDGCDRTFGSERGLAAHQTRSHTTKERR